MTNHPVNFTNKTQRDTRDTGTVQQRRFDLFEKIPLLKKFCKWRFQFPLVFSTLVMFCFFLYAGLFGSRLGNRNIIVLFVWILWWFLLITFMVPFASRIWCLVCPFPFFGEWFQRGALTLVRPGKTGTLRNKMFGLNKKWPKALTNIWLQNIFFLGICTFSAHLLTRPIVSVLVLGGLFLIATVLAIFYRQRAFCMYVCPVGGFQGLYAMTAMIELRAKDSTICNRIKPGLDYSFEAGIAPCRSACPAGVDASSYISLVKEKKYQQALELVHEALPFASVCGRICHHPCEDKCLRGDVDEPISICKLKRFIAENVDYSKILPQGDKMPRFKEKVAIVGGGPCGLTCAYHLAQEGYEVKVFESQPVAGGMLRLTIPEHKLPQSIVDKEVQFIKDSGVQIVTGVEIGKDVSWDELKKEYQAVFVAIGASKSRALRIEGEELKGVLYAIDFLRDVKFGEEVSIGKKVVIIGAGKTAEDVAGTVLRLGTKEAICVEMYEEEDMLPFDELTKAEGARVLYSTSPIKITGGNGEATSLLCVKLKKGEIDETTGRHRLLPVKGSEQLITADNIIIATGQYSDISFLPEQLAVSKADTILTDGETMATNIPGVFAGGDVVSGPDMLIYAIAVGRKAAMNIHRYLQGEDLGQISLHPTNVVMEELPLETIAKRQRILPTILDLESRKQGFAEVEQVFTERMALDEAGRCLSCGICGDCFHGTDQGWACPWFQKMGTMKRNNYCSMCMECVKSCPHDNIGLFVRPFAQDKKIKGYDESWKAFIMLALAILYSVTLLGPWGTIKDWANVAETGNWKGFLTYAGIIWFTAMIGIPAVWALVCWLGKILSGTTAIGTKKLFIQYSYMLVPLGLMAWIAFSFPLIMINGAYIISTISDPLGWGWDIFGTANVPWTPILSQYTAHIQIPLLLLGLYFALKRGYDISLTLYHDNSQAVRSLIPAGVFCTILIFVFLRLFTG